MSRTKNPAPSRAPRAPLVALSAVGLAVAALAVGFWLGGAGSSERRATGGPAGDVVPAAAPVEAPVEAPAAVAPSAYGGATHAGGDALSSTSVGVQPGAAEVRTSAEAPTVDEAPAEFVESADGVQAAAPAAPEPELAEEAVAEAIDPALLYEPAYSDHEPEALAAIEEGRLGQPALVMFHADWCHVCQEVMPEVYELRERYQGEMAVLKVDVDRQHPAMARYPVRGTPTFVFFDRGGQAVKTQRGWPGEPLMAQYMDMSLTLQ